MIKLWAKIKSNNKIIMEKLIEIDDSDNEEDQLFDSINTVCYEFDIERPMWLPKNQREYENFRRIILTQDNFIDEINFDLLEIELIDD